MMKSLILFFVLTAFFSCSKNTFEKISKKVDYSRDYTYYQMYFPFFHHYRMELKRNGELDFINIKKDTFYIQEVFYTEASPMMIGSIWNSKKIVNYTFIGKKREYPGIELIDSNLIKYVNKNDANIVEYYGKLPQHLVKNQYYFEKIIVDENKYKIVEAAKFLY